MRENELADLLMRMASERGVDIETAAEELASIALPSFVDARQFRSAVIQALENSLRAQVEERLQSIRRRFDVTPQQQRVVPQPIVAQPVASPVVHVQHSASVLDGHSDFADATVTEMTALSVEPDSEPAVAAEEELPTDATMVWTTRHG
jgi:hypothetical protein